MHEHTKRAPKTSSAPTHTVFCNVKKEAGIKHDQEKIRTDLLPVRPIEEICKVLTYGATKYKDRNWEQGLLYSRCYGAALRHLFSWWSGEDNDKETKLSHLAHAGCCILFLLELMETHKELDNRPKRRK